MNSAFSSFLSELKSNPKGTLLALVFFVLYTITSSPDLLNGFPEGAKEIIKNVATLTTKAVIAYGLYCAVKPTGGNDLENELEKLQQKPTQTVLPAPPEKEKKPKSERIKRLPIKKTHET